MKFRTEIKIEKSPFLLNPKREVLLIGSCFSDNIGEKLENSGVPAVTNPCGVVYNPASMALLMQLALTNPAIRRNIISSSVTEREGKFVSWFMDSKCCGDTPESLVDAACERIDALESSIEKAETMILTFGTSDVWLLKNTDCAVGNCHKHPASEFEKRRLGVKEIAETWSSIIDAVRQRNESLKVIFTVSPRRYLSGGFADNSRLKAILLLAVEEICGHEKNCGYFPAYEIMNDDLRDYRFYAQDMIHPSGQAVEYIWERFKENYYSPEDQAVLKQGEKEWRRNSHRPILPII